MSGTPTLGNPEHLYSPLRFLSPALVPPPTAYYKYKEAYLIMAQPDSGPSFPVGYKNMHLLNKKVNMVAKRIF